MDCFTLIIPAIIIKCVVRVYTCASFSQHLSKQFVCRFAYINLKIDGEGSFYFIFYKLYILAA